MGGEQSGHLIFLDHATTGDGTLAALQLLAVMCRQQKPLSELASDLRAGAADAAQRGGQAARRSSSELPAVTARDQGRASSKLGKDGRVLVRYSGTEPKARVLIEGPDKARNEEHAQTVAAALTAALG